MILKISNDVNDSFFETDLLNFTSLPISLDFAIDHFDDLPVRLQNCFDLVALKSFCIVLNQFVSNLIYEECCSDDNS